MKSSEQKILYLFDEIGRIDDKYIAEAMSYEKALPKRRSFTKLLALAACIALISALCLVGVANIANTFFEGDKSGAPSDGNTVYETPDALCEVMTELEVEFLDSARVYSAPAELVFDGNVRIIWTYGNGVYYSLSLSSYDARVLENYLSSESGAIVSPNEAYGNFRFYVSYGDGRVETPYVEDNAGRLSVGSLSDYLPEVYPSHEFADFISSLVKNAEN